jgi:type IV pilus assembly protein PilA
MFTKIHKRMKSEKGFTLIELLVVIIIIAILAAIAIPTFLGQRQKAHDFVTDADGGVCTAVPAIAATADADAEQVDYYGTASTFQIATESLSGNLFGVVTDKGTGGETTFVKKIGSAAASVGW